MIRYADDLLALCHSREQAEQVKARLAEWLAPRGLVFNEDKTQITHLDQGVDFLGFNIRRYPRQAADQAEQRRAAADPETAVHRGEGPARGQRRRGDRQAQPDHHRVGRLLPDRGVQTRVQRAGRPHVEAGLQVGQRSPIRTSRRAGSIARYFGKFNPARQDKWVFGSRDTGFYLRKFAWTPIVRHRMVAGTASPDDPSLADYWAQRRRRSTPPLGTATLRLLRVQHGRCPLCRGLLLHADREPQSPREWEQWLTATRKAIRKHAITAWGARHAGRTRRTPASYTPTATAGPPAAAASTALLHCPRAFRACLSRLPGKRARPVLRGPRRSNAPGLPDGTSALISPNGRRCRFASVRSWPMVSAASRHR